MESRERKKGACQSKKQRKQERPRSTSDASQRRTASIHQKGVQRYSDDQLHRRHRKRIIDESMGTVSTSRRRSQRKKESEGDRHSSPMTKKKQRSLVGVFFQMIFSLIFYAFTISIILTAVLFGLNSNENASLYGYRFYTVMTNSMVPIKGQITKGVIKGFYAQDVLIVKNTSYNQIQKDDVVTYTLGNDKSYLTHRVIEKIDHVGDKEGDFLITKGDANRTDDPPVLADRLVGKAVFVVPYVGYILEFIRDYFWLCLVFVFGLFGSLLVLKMYFFG